MILIWMYFKGDYMLLKNESGNQLFPLCAATHFYLLVCDKWATCWRIWQLMLNVYCCFFTCIVSLINRMSLSSCLVLCCSTRCLWAVNGATGQREARIWADSHGEGDHEGHDGRGVEARGGAEGERGDRSTATRTGKLNASASFIHCIVVVAI